MAKQESKLIIIKDLIILNIKIKHDLLNIFLLIAEGNRWPLHHSFEVDL